MELMWANTTGFRDDGWSPEAASEFDTHPEHFFYAADQRHPGRTGHAAMAELAIYLLQQACSSSALLLPLSRLGACQIKSEELFLDHVQVNFLLCVQAAIAEMASPSKSGSWDAIEALADMPEPLFPGNKGDESSLCLLNESMRCGVASCL